MPKALGKRTNHRYGPYLRSAGNAIGTALSLYRDFSGTATNTQTTHGNVKHSTDHGHCTTSGTTYSKPNRKADMMMRGSPQVQHNALTAQKVRSESGFQNAQLIAFVNDYNSWVDGVERQSVADGGTLISVDPRSNTNLRKHFQCPFTTVKIAMKNNGNTKCHFVLYECVCKKDTNLDPITAWATGLTQKNEQIKADGNFADTSETNVNATGPQVNTYKQTPMQSQVFKTNWRVIKVTSYTMAPGAEHNHYQTTKCHRALQPIDWYTQVATDQFQMNYKRDYSLVTMLVIHGTPAQVEGASNDVTISKSGLDIVRSFKKTMKHSITEIRGDSITSFDALVKNVNTKVTELSMQNDNAQGHIAANEILDAAVIT